MNLRRASNDGGGRISSLWRRRGGVRADFFQASFDRSYFLCHSDRSRQQPISTPYDGLVNAYCWKLV